MLSTCLAGLRTPWYPPKELEEVADERKVWAFCGVNKINTCSREALSSGGCQAERSGLGGLGNDRLDQPGWRSADRIYQMRVNNSLKAY